MKNLFLSAIAVFALQSSPSTAQQFVGKLQFEPGACPSGDQVKLVYDYGYIDSRGGGWQTVAGDCTDGASIPFWAKPFIGGSFDPQFIGAAVIHDHYCDRHVHSWRETNWVFYDALLAGGVTEAKAEVMYYAVAIGGPKWISLIEGVPCKVGNACIESVNVPTKIPRSAIVTSDSGQLMAVRPAQYDRLDMASELKAVADLVEQPGAKVSLADLDARAKARNPDDFFLQNPDSIQYQGPRSKFPVQ